MFASLSRLSLKRRFIFTLMLITMIPLLAIGTISYYSIYSVLENKIQSGVQNNLRQVTLSLETALDNLNHVSQQMALNESIKVDLEKYTTSTSVYQKSELEKELKREFNLINFTNPTIGLMFYYFDEEQEVNFQNYPVKSDFNPDELPIFRQYGAFTYYGPHTSNNTLDNSLVLSIQRHIDLASRNDIYLYLETSFKFTEKILESDKYGMAIDHLIVDENGRVTYTENPEDFQIGKTYDLTEDKVELNDHYLFHNTSDQGWSIVTVVSKSEYNKEITNWVKQFSLVTLLTLIAAFLLAWLMWKMVYVPLIHLRKEIRRMGDSNFHSEIKKSNIPEYADLLDQFWHTRKQVWELLVEVEQKEKRRADLEVEKLMYQINPHFLHNTLDTVSWIARLNGQDEIDKLVSSLNKLLHYNLGKQGKDTTIAGEIEALKQYLILQQIRYDFKFNVRIEADKRVEAVAIPRFILQPLVENSLYHGLGDDGVIDVSVHTVQEEGEPIPSQIIIKVSDNGVGISEQAILDALHNERGDHTKMGFGIGINYVKRILEARYGEKGKLQIVSKPGEGTTVLLHIPLLREE